VGLNKSKYGICEVWCLYGQAILGLKINLVKSELVLVGHVPNVEALADILGCRVSALPLTHPLIPKRNP
jgi:hypothetical protein